MTGKRLVQAAYLLLIYGFLYIPIGVLIVYSFNDSKYSLEWRGMTWEWYETLFDDPDLLQAALRMRPDRIILGELRGGEAYTFLRAVNTGHPGSLTTIHADSPDRAIEQLALIVLQTGTQLTREDIVHYIRSVVDLVVQLERRGGQRIVSQIMTTRA